MTNDELLHKWINNTITETELEAFKLRPEYSSLAELYLQTEGLTVSEFDTERMLSDILSTPKLQKTLPVHNVEENISPRRSFMKWTSYGIAACVLFAVGFFANKSLNSDQLVKYDVAEGQEIEGTFPDQSSFVLKGDSKLHYDLSDWNNERKVELQGEALFKVEKGVNFSVNTPTGTVQVLGTEFNVYSRDNMLKVSCLSGKVRVSSEKIAKYSETLVQDESMKLTSDGSSKTWKKNLTKLRMVSFEEVIKALEQEYNIEIQSDKVAVKDKITCNFTNQDLDQALKTSLGPLGINFDKEENNTIIRLK